MILERIAVLVASSTFFVSQAFAELERPKLLSGKWEQGAIIELSVDPKAKLQWGDRDILVTPKGVALLGLGRDAPASIDIKMQLKGKGAVFKFDITPREYKISRVEGIPKKIMSPNDDDLKRIRKESAQIRAARAQISERTNFLEDFEWPAIGRISGVYGSQRYYNGEPGRPHYGVDVAQPTGTPVYAPAGGKVVLAESDLFYSGGTIIIDHGYGLNSSFLHLSAIDVRDGDVVEKGDLIGKIGSTGRSTGPHLDWRMNWRDQRVDPQPLVGEMPKPETKQ